MGREIKRVPLDFGWPRNKVWKGYINPYYVHCHDCKTCNGRGYSEYAKHLHDKWYGNAPFKPEDRGSIPFSRKHPIILQIAERNITQAPYFYGLGPEALKTESKRLADLFNSRWMHHLSQDDVDALIEADRLHDFTHTFDLKSGWKKKDWSCDPTPQQVNEWSLVGMAHDGINSWVVIKAECARLGVPCNCASCNGEGSMWDSDEAKLNAESWNREEPPKGEAYQLWETVSEGSPISKVFATPELLADWLVTCEYKWKKNHAGITYEQWVAFIRGPGWSPSLVCAGGQVMNGVQAVV